MSERSKSAIITFLGNAYHDSRVVNLIESLEGIHIGTTTISFDWKSDQFKSIIGKTSVYKLEKRGNSLGYYFKFLFILIRDLLRNKADFYFAEDIYTLPITYLFAKLNKGMIFYNSREIYAQLAGLRERNIVQKIISKIENGFIRKVDLVLVTGQMDAEYLGKVYSINNFLVLRNLPKFSDKIEKVNLQEKLNIPKSRKVILYQGVILEGRGIIRIMKALEKIHDVHFVIVGEGEFREKFENESKQMHHNDRIHFLGAVSHLELLNYTAGADLGLAVIENISVSYYYALPNKLFEYIMAGVPVLASNLPQMKKVIDEFDVGRYVDPEKEEDLIKCLVDMLTDSEKLNEYKSNCQAASKLLNWENEFDHLKEHLVNK